MTTGDYGVTVSAPVCGTGCPGSIPGSRPRAGPRKGSFACGRLRKQISLLSSGNRSHGVCDEQPQGARHYEWPTKNVRVFTVGDRVEVNGIHGDVVDIGLFYSTLLEIREWVNGDQSTGRLLSVPNGVVLSGVVKNYTKDHPFLWDELAVVITSDSDWQAAMHILGTICFGKTEHTIEAGRSSLHRLRRRYYINAKSLEPVVYMQNHENGIELITRYVVETAQRRQIKSEIWEQIYQQFAQHPKIAIAPPGFAAVPCPTVEQS